MLEHFDQATKRTIFFARYEASISGSPTIAPEHLWLGALRQDKAAVAKVAPEITSAHLNERLQAIPRADLPTSLDLPFAENVANALKIAALRAQAFPNGEVSLLHVLHVLRELDFRA